MKEEKKIDSLRNYFIKAKFIYRIAFFQWRFFFAKLNDNTIYQLDELLHESLDFMKKQY